MEQQLNELKNTIQQLQNQRNETEQKYNNFISFLGISSVAVMLTAFLLSVLGVIDLRYSSVIILPNLLETIINMFLLFLNTICVLKLTQTERLLHWFNISIIVLVCSSFIPNPYNYIFQSIVFPILIVSVVIINDKLYPKLKIILGSYAFVILSKQLLSIIKAGYINLDLVNPNTVTVLCYSLDLYLIYLFLIKGVSHHGLFLEFLFLSKGKSIQQNANSLQEIANSENLTREQRLKFFALAMGYQFAQLFIVLAIGLINNMLAELLIMLVNFWIGRKILGNCWHSDELWICSVTTFLSFYILVKVTPPLEISLFICTLTSGVFVWLLYMLGDKFDKLKTLEDTVTPVMSFAKTLRDLGFTEKDIIFICEIKFLNKSVKEQASKYGITEKSIKNKRTEIYKSLSDVNIKIK